MAIPIEIVPIIAIAIVVISFALRGLVWQNRSSNSRPRNPWYTIGVCAVGLLVFAAFFYKNDGEERLYESDSACASGFALPYAMPGKACELETARITGAYQTYGRGSSRHIRLALPDGSQHDVSIAASSGHPVFIGARSRVDRTASVQLFRARIVAVRTNSGEVRSNSHPANRRQKFGLLGIILGAVGVALCLKVALFGR